MTDDVNLLLVIKPHAFLEQVKRNNRGEQSVEFSPPDTQKPHNTHSNMTNCYFFNEFLNF